MLSLLSISVFLITSILLWFVLGWLRRMFISYRATFTEQTTKDLSDMFLFLDPRQVWFASLVSCSVLAGWVYVFTSSYLIGASVACVTLFIPPYVLAKARRRRLQRLEQQLPDLLLALAGALRAGSGLQSALRHIATHVPPPLSQELGLMLREQRMGVSFEQALANVHLRVPVESISLIVSALNIAAQSGGNLAETLDRIAVTLRTRLHLLGRVRALTAQGRMQAWVMAGLPFVLALILHGLDPGTMAALWNTPAGWAVMGLVIVLEVIGILLIRRIVQIEV